MKPVTPRQPRNRNGFCWVRVIRDGAITYRLFRRDLRGVTHYEFHTFRTEPRQVVACTLMEARHRLRNLVDDIDLKLLGVSDDN
jgi:hypothetical protein